MVFESSLEKQLITWYSIAVCGRLFITSSLQFLSKETKTLFIGRERLLVTTELKDKSR